jgi:hypothetical protein
MNILSGNGKELGRESKPLGLPGEEAYLKDFCSPTETQGTNADAILANAIRLLVHRDGLEYADKAEYPSVKSQEKQCEGLLLETLTAAYINR